MADSFVALIAIDCWQVEFSLGGGVVSWSDANLSS